MNKKIQHSKILIEISYISLIILGVLFFLLYYVKKYNFILDLIITLLVLSLAIESFLYSHKTEKYKIYYLLIASLFVIVTIVHTARLFYGPLQCFITSAFISIFLYDSIAMFIGIIFVFSSLYLMKKKSGSRRIHMAVIIIGIIMILNHFIKIAVGKCV